MNTLMFRFFQSGSGYVRKEGDLVLVQTTTPYDMFLAGDTSLGDGDKQEGEVMLSPWEQFLAGSSDKS
ncbi:MAG: hypothetical protein ACXABY_27050 [Candidatus Thorarchaeota archaeon]|jgi:hypothetical protein